MSSRTNGYPPSPPWGISTANSLQSPTPDYMPGPRADVTGSVFQKVKAWCGATSPGLSTLLERVWHATGTPGKILYPVLGGQGSPPREKKSRHSWMKAGQGVCERRHSCPESGMCREKGLLSSPMMGRSGVGMGGLGEGPADAEG